MISLHFGIALDKVEDVSIVDYKLMLFTIFNNAVLHSMAPDGFRYETDDDAQNRLDREHRKLFPEKYN